MHIKGDKLMSNQPPSSDVNEQDNLDVAKLDLFIQLKGFKPLSDKELSKGKAHLRIYGTQDPMPWNTIYTRMASGQPLAEIGKQYGHIRKLILWAKIDNVKLDQHLNNIINTESAVRDAVIEVANDDPEAAMTLLQRMNEVNPDFQTKVANVAHKIIEKISVKLDDKYLEAQDLSHLANSLQKVTDTVGETQRHSSGININNNSLNIPEGFGLIPAIPPPDWNPEEIMAEAHDIIPDTDNNVRGSNDVS